MATSVAVTQTPASPTVTTWATASYAWNSSSATSSWASARDSVSFLVAVNETLTSAENYASVASFSRGFSETLTSVESVSQQFAQSVTESFGVVENYADVANFTRAFNETLTAAENYTDTALFVRAFSDSLAVSEMSSGDYGMAIEEAFSVLGAGYSWSNATFSWLDSGGQSWADPDRFSKSVTKVASESLSVAETYSDIASFSRNMSESLSVAEARTSDVSTAIAENLMAADAFGAGIQFARAFAENVAIAESNGAAYQMLQSESFAASDAYDDVVLFDRNINELLAITDSIAKGHQQIIPESFGVVDDKQFAISILSAESITLSELFSESAQYIRNVGETFRIIGSSRDWSNADVSWSATGGLNWLEGEGLQKSVNTTKSESIGVAESYASTSAFAREFAESLMTVEIGSSAGQTSSFIEALTVADSCQTNLVFLREFAESVSFGDGVGKLYAMLQAESLNTSDSSVSSAGKNLGETLAVADSLDRLASFARALAETLTIAESVAKTAGISKSESLRLVDLIRQNSRAIISDLSIRQGDLTPDDFLAMLAQAAPPGYGQFVPFTEGDHEYKNAIFKAVIRAQDSSRGRLTGLAVNVDVPDINDSGSVTVSTDGLYVPFNRTFNAPPEVNVTVKGGTVFCIPRVRDITTAGFMVELFTPDGVMAAGNVFWKAHGY